jgi:hypothetical protein
MIRVIHSAAQGLRPGARKIVIPHAQPAAAWLAPPGAEDESRWEDEGGAVGESFEWIARPQPRKEPPEHRNKAGLRLAGRRLRHGPSHANRRRRS